jgi:outer membrane protein assembly factor BamB
LNDSLLFIGNIHGRLDAFHQNDGAQEWTYQVQSNDARKDSLKQVQWNQREATAKLNVLATVSIDDSCLYYTESGGEVGCLKQATGNVKWQTRTNDRIYSVPLVTDLYVYVTTMSSHFFVLDKSTGKILQKLKVTGSVYASPVIAGNHVCFGTESGMVYGFTSKSDLPH